MLNLLSWAKHKVKAVSGETVRIKRYDSNTEEMKTVFIMGTIPVCRPRWAFAAATSPRRQSNPQLCLFFFNLALLSKPLNKINALKFY